MVIDTAEALTAQLAASLARGRRNAALFSEQLDHRIYDHSAVAEAMRSMALAHQHVRIDILLRRCDRVLKGGDHALIDLARRMPSRIRVLQADRITCGDEREWLLVDDSDCILRQQADRIDAIHRDDDPGMVRPLKAAFERYWAHGQPSPDLAQLSL